MLKKQETTHTQLHHLISRKWPFLFTLILFVCFQVVAVKGQKIEIEANNTQLNQVLYEIGNRHNIAFSYNDKFLSKFKVSIDSTFTTTESMINGLICGFPITCEKFEDVYFFFPKPTSKVNKNDSLFISGTIYDLTTYEPLPYASVAINHTHKYTNNSGRFSYIHTNSDSLQIIVSYIGHGIIDTTIAVKNYTHELEFFLKPTQVNLKEVIVRKINFQQAIIGKETGKMKANTQIANYLPGIGDNALFQFLGMMPGIQVAGGNSGSMSIWSGNPSNTVYEFDGIRIYSPDHFYGNIGILNQLTVKDVQVTKGIAGSNNNDAPEGLIKMTGKNGNRLKPSFTAELNNLTLNLLFESPAGPSNTFLVSARGLYRNPENTTYFRSTNEIPDTPPTGLQTTDNLKPSTDISSNYLFGDIQLKFSGAIGTKKNYYINLYQSIDISSLATDSTQQETNIYIKDQNRWGNTGAVFFYNQNWNSKFSTEITAGISSNFENSNSAFKNLNTLNDLNDITAEKLEQLWDYSLKNTNSINLKSSHFLKFGLGANHYRIHNRMVKNDTLQPINTNNTFIPYIFVQDRINFTNKLYIDLGVRCSYSTLAKQIVFSPNTTITYDINPTISVGLNTGRGHSMYFRPGLAFEGIKGDNANYFRLANNNDIKTASTNILAVNFNHTNYWHQLSIEGFIKQQENVTEYVPDRDNLSLTPNMRVETGYYTGNIRANGFTVYNRFNFKKLSFWQTYAFSNSKKLYPEIYGDNYVATVNTQKHEFKTAAVKHIKNFSLSGTYTFGSGYPYNNFRKDKPYQFTQIPTISQKHYHRLDCSIVYKIKFEKLYLKTGISLLNVLNNNNQRYQYFGRSFESNSASCGYYQINTLPRVLSAYVHISL